MYGVDLHPVLVCILHQNVEHSRVHSNLVGVLTKCILLKQGEDSVEYFLGLAPSGLLLLRGKHTVANYYWPRVSKLYYKGRYFMLRVADKNVSNTNSCKNKFPER